jgi:hypothetical protein
MESRGRTWRKTVVGLTALLTVSVFLACGAMVWAQGGEEQPQQGEEVREGLTIEYFEPQVGTRWVYRTNDFMDVYGQKYGTSTLGYWDDYYLYTTTFYNFLPFRVNWASSYYRSVSAVSNLYPVYFDQEGPWYFNMTTPWKVICEVVGIHEAPDSASFPQATYAVRFLYILSGGMRVYCYSYRSNSSEDQRWYEWGYTAEYVKPGEERLHKDIVRYRSPSDPTLDAPLTLVTFPLYVGATGSIESVIMEGGVDFVVTSPQGSFDVVADGEIMLPSGTYDALMIKVDGTRELDGGSHRFIHYTWFAGDVGTLVFISSLPDILGPEFGTATEIYVLDEFTKP